MQRPSSDRTPDPADLRRRAGHELRRLREARGLTPRALGHLLGSTDPSRAGARVAALEQGRTVPDGATRTALRAALGALPDGWDRAEEAERLRAADQALDRATALRALAAVLPVLAEHPDRMRAGWEDLPVRWPSSGTSLTGTLRVTLGALVWGGRPGGPLEVRVGGQDGWIVAASGSLLSGRGTILVLTRGGRWVEDNAFGTLNVGAAWRRLAAACQGHAAERAAAGGEAGAHALLTWTDVERELLGRRTRTSS